MFECVVGRGRGVAYCWQYVLEAVPLREHLHGELGGQETDELYSRALLNRKCY